MQQSKRYDGKGHTLHTACLSEGTSRQRRYGTHYRGISQFYLLSMRLFTNGITTPTFASPAITGPLLPTPEGWKAELAMHQHGE